MSVLKRTNQIWKLYLFVAAMVFGAAATLFQSFLPKLLPKEMVVFFAVGGMLLVIAAFAWAYASIACPNCKLKLFWYSIVKVGLGTWFTWLVNLEKCPQCASCDGLPAPSGKQGRFKAKRAR